MTLKMLNMEGIFCNQCRFKRKRFLFPLDLINVLPPINVLAKIFVKINRRPAFNKDVLGKIFSQINKNVLDVY